MAGSLEPSSKPVEGNVMLALLSFLAFAVGNITLNYFNSWVLHDAPEEPYAINSTTNGTHQYPGHGKAAFNFPFFYTMWHMLATSLAGLVLQLTCAKPPDGMLPSLGQLWTYKYQLFPIGALTVLNNGFNNMSLGIVALFVNQSIKACGPAPTALFEYIFARKVYTFPVYLVVSVIVAGSVIANYDSIMAGGSTQVRGVIFIVISMLAASLRPVLQKLLISGGAGAAGIGDRPPLSPPQALFWDGLIAFCGMFTVWICSNERQAAIEYLLGDTANPNSGWIGLGCIVFGSTVAFSFNLATYYFVMYTNALTSTIGSNGVKIFLIICTAVSDGVTEVLSWVGIVIVVVSIGLYAYLFYGMNSAPAPPTYDKAEPLAKPADEKTPLAASTSGNKV